MRICGKTLSLAVALLFTGSALAAGGVYKWVDEDGVVHYGERPPQQTQAQEVRVQPPASESQRAAAGEEGAEQPERSAELQRLLREEQCQRWTQALSEYRAADFLTKPTEDGGSRRLTLEETAQTIAEAERMVAENCGDG